MKIKDKVVWQSSYTPNKREGTIVKRIPKGAVPAEVLTKKHLERRLKFNPEVSREETSYVVESAGALYRPKTQLLKLV